MSRHYNICGNNVASWYLRKVGYMLPSVGPGLTLKPTGPVAGGAEGAVGAW